MAILIKQIVCKFLSNMFHPLTSDVSSAFNYKALFLHSPLPMFTCDERGYVDSFNAAAEQLWARAPEPGKHKWCGSIQLLNTSSVALPPDKFPMAIAFTQRKAVENLELVVKRSDDTYRNVMAFAQPVFNTAGAVTAGFGTLIDITENKTAKEKQAMLSAIVESSDDAIISKNLHGLITSWNRGAQKIFGYTEDEVVGKHISILIPEELKEEEEHIIAKIKAGKKIDHFQTVRITKFGKRVDISLTISPIRNENGEITGASKISRDITEQLQKQKALQQYSHRLEILNALGTRISAKLDEASIVQLVTNATTEITGAAFGAFFTHKSDEQGKPYRMEVLSGASKELLKTTEVQKNTKLLKQVFDNKSVVRIEDILQNEQGFNWPYYQMPNNKCQVSSYMAVPLMNTSGNVFGGLFFGHPLPGAFTREHEELVKSIASQASVALENSALFKQVKLLSEKKDEFIALASHELKTPLTTVSGYLQLLQTKASDSTSQLFIERSILQIAKLNSLVSDLFDISKVEAGRLQLNYEFFDMYRLLQEVTETYQHSCSTHQVVLQYKGSKCVVEADRQRMEQVIINLITNAIKYSPNTDQVLIKLKQSKTELTVMVKDQGIGLSEEQQKKIFTRFYRAEGTSNISGLGLGLYLSNEIISRHHGKIYVKSKPGLGAEFYFSIPLKKDSISQ